MESLNVIKYSGEKETFNEKKVLGSIVNSGLTREEALGILAHIKPKLYDGISTRDLYKLVYETVDKESRTDNVSLYRMRETLGEIGSFEFEKFVKGLLEKRGFDCIYDSIIEGCCVAHQVDIIAKKKDEIFYVEVKHHKNYHRDTGLGEVCEIWARYEDMKKGFEKRKNNFNFSNPWLFTNTKISDHGQRYAKCKSMRLTSWKVGLDGSSLEDMVRELDSGQIQKIVEKSKINSSFKGGR